MGKTVRGLLAFLALTVMYFCWSGQIRAERILYFPFCSGASSVQSERLNNLHQLLHRVSTRLYNKAGNTFVVDEQVSDCSEISRQLRALIAGSDRFVQGSYLIGRDTVTLSVSVIQTRFIDRKRGEFDARDHISRVDSLIARVLEFVVRESALIVTDTTREAISLLIAEDRQRYSGTGLGLGNMSKAYIGIAAYQSGNYRDAALFLREAVKEDTLYGEAMFCMARICMGNNDYNQAIRHIREGMSVGYREKHLQEYLTQCNMLNRPYDWFDTELKRMDWWNSLTPEQSQVIIRLMNNLLINGKNFNENYTYMDKDIQSLFQTRVLALQNIKVDDLLLFRHFTRVDLIVLENTRLKTDEGLDYFTGLKIIRTDEKPKTKGMKKLCLNGTVAILLNRL